MADHATLAAQVADKAREASDALHDAGKPELAAFVRRLGGEAARALGTDSLRCLAPVDEDEARFLRLREWRADEARTRQIPPYVIATDAVLRAIAYHNPMTPQNLVGVQALGVGKIQRYGEAIVAACQGT